MSDIDDLKRRIEEKLAAVQERKRQKHQEIHEYVMDIQQRQQRFREVAAPLMETIVQPRLEQLASYFPNAEFVAEPGRSLLHRRLQFRHTERFPASVKLELSLSPDREVRTLVVSCDLEILPVLIQFKRHQELGLPLDTVDQEQLATWVSERLCDFLDTYLQLEHTASYHQESLVIDPVCGMRIAKAFAAAQAEHAGQTYYFCIDACRQKFENDPHRYTRPAES
jgi:YHS domain-containing protein